MGPIINGTANNTGTPNSTPSIARETGSATSPFKKILNFLSGITTCSKTNSAMVNGPTDQMTSPPTHERTRLAATHEQNAASHRASIEKNGMTELPISKKLAQEITKLETQFENWLNKTKPTGSNTNELKLQLNPTILKLLQKEIQTLFPDKKILCIQQNCGYKTNDIKDADPERQSTQGWHIDKRRGYHPTVRIVIPIPQDIGTPYIPREHKEACTGSQEKFDTNMVHSFYYIPSHLAKRADPNKALVILQTTSDLPDTPANSVFRRNSLVHRFHISDEENYKQRAIIRATYELIPKT